MILKMSQNWEVLGTYKERKIKIWKTGIHDSQIFFCETIWKIRSNLTPGKISNHFSILEHFWKNPKSSKIEPNSKKKRVGAYKEPYKERLAYFRKGGIPYMFLVQFILYLLNLIFWVI